MKSKGIPTPRSAIEAVLAAIAPIKDTRILDSGCGSGELVGALAGLGAAVTGIDPEAAAVALAQKRCPEAEFKIGAAERLPFESGSFDAVVMVNSLHHVPVKAMALALQESKRVLACGGHLIVIEPEARGSFFEALRPIEDETEIRAAAQKAISEAVASGLWESVHEFSYTRTESFADVSAFVARVVAVDPLRQQAADRKFGEIEALFQSESRRGGNGLHELDQPILVWVLIPILRKQRGPDKSGP